MAPFALIEMFGKPIAYGIYLVIGVAFGAVLEMAGFADSRRLAAQFYLRNMTVLKVMFGAIVTAMALIFLSSAIGILDYGRVWVNPTFLLPGIVGGLIMGFGFILGGFCPGTSIVAAATLKIDGILFFLGVSLGVFLFGETVGLYEGFYHSTSMGRFTLPEWLGLPTGWVVLLVVCMALFMFWGAEKLEAKFGGGAETRSAVRRGSKARLAGAGALLGVALLGLAIGQPSPDEQWERVARQKQRLLDDREVQIDPAELVDLAENRQVRLVLLDVRDERDYNLFHIVDAQHVTMEEIRDGLVGLTLLSAAPNTVTVLMSNREARATEAWKLLTAGGVLNLYILEGGIENWLDAFGHAGCETSCAGVPGSTSLGDDEGLRHRFEYALGASQAGADPDDFAGTGRPYTPKVKLQTKKKMGGGCG